MKNLCLEPSSSEIGSAVAGMFAARKKVFVDLLGWDIPVREDRFEVDQFDTKHAVYLCLDAFQRPHRGSVRLLETERPHILANLFPALCAGTPPRGPHVREITRFCIDPDLPRNQHRQARNELVSALALHAAETGIAAYTAVAGLAWFRSISRFGWDCHALGEPREINGEVLVGLQITIGPNTLARLAERGVIREPRYQLHYIHEGVWE